MNQVLAVDLTAIIPLTFGALKAASAGGYIHGRGSE